MNRAVLLSKTATFRGTVGKKYSINTPYDLQLSVDQMSPSTSTDSDIGYINSIDNYNEQEYNDYGWIVVNNVLTASEIKRLYGQFSDIVNNKKYSKKSSFGEHLILVGNNYSDIDHLVLISGSISHPKITKVISVSDEIPETEKANYLKELCYGKQGDCNTTREILGSFAGTQIFFTTTYRDFASYVSIKRQTESITRGNGNIREREIGAGSISTNNGNESRLNSESKNNTCFDDIQYSTDYNPNEIRLEAARLNQDYQDGNITLEEFTQKISERQRAMQYHLPIIP